MGSIEVTTSLICGPLSQRNDYSGATSHISCIHHSWSSSIASPEECVLALLKELPVVDGERDSGAALLCHAVSLISRICCSNPASTLCTGVVCISVCMCVMFALATSGLRVSGKWP